MKTGRSILFPFLLILILISVGSGCSERISPQPEFRAVWLHQTMFDRDETKGKEQIITLLDKYAETGINNLFCYYTLPEENGLTWDYLSFITYEGKKRNIGIHPIFCPGQKVNPEKAMEEHPGWLIRKADGEIFPSYNIANPEVRKYWLSVISEALKYDIAGIHLDYIRYPVNQMFSYDSVTCAEFKKEYGFSPLEVSHDGGSIIWCEWIAWNRNQVTEFVRETKKLIDDSGKNILLGTDVFPDPAESETEIGQNWKEWASEGLVDFVCPMLYTDSVSLFRKYTDMAITAAEGKCKVYPGIGINTSHNKITPEILREEIMAAREQGAEGVVFFSGYSFNNDLIDTLAETVFKPLSSGTDLFKGVKAKDKNPEIISVQQIWSEAPHNAFTDLIRYKNKWYCTFRESTRHVYGTDGKIRVLASSNGDKWVSVALFEREGVDLRDPKLCITPDNRLMLHMGGSIYADKERIGFKHAVAFSEDGKSWSEMKDINITDKWPWRPEWHNNKAYVVAYDTAAVMLYCSDNGYDYEKIGPINPGGFANETALWFLPDNTMFAIIRREKGNHHAYTGTAVPPYDSWTLKETGYFIGGPDIIEISGQLYGAGRCFIDGEPKTVLGKIDDGNFTPALVLPSGGDCSYPGMVCYKKVLWMSYYSSHEGRTSIYLAKIRIH